MKKIKLSPGGLYTGAVDPVLMHLWRKLAQFLSAVYRNFLTGRPSDFFYFRPGAADLQPTSHIKIFDQHSKCTSKPFYTSKSKNK